MYFSVHCSLVYRCSLVRPIMVVLVDVCTVLVLLLDTLLVVIKLQSTHNSLLFRHS